MKRIEIYENGINIVFEITDENEAKLLHFSALPFDEAKTASYMGLKTFRPVEIQASGIDRPDERHGNKYIVTAPGWRMKFKDFRDVNNDYGRKLELVTFDEGTGLEAVSHYQFYTVLYPELRLFRRYHPPLCLPRFTVSRKTTRAG